MEQTVATRMAGIAPFYVMELLEKAQQLETAGKSVIHMEVGEPDFPLPKEVAEAATAALTNGKTGYTAAGGIAELRTAVTRYYQQGYGVNIPSSRVLITPGSSGALQLIIGAVVNAGEEVIMTDPTYPCNKHFVLAFGGVPKTVPVDAKTHYQLTAEMVEAAWKPNTRAVMVASPSNPTGTLLAREELAKIHAVVEARGGVLIVDEIYQKLLYQVKGYTALSLSDNLVVINSFSKYFGMTGLRAGWLVAPPNLLDPLTRLAQNFFISPPTPSQYAALRAMEADCAEIFDKRRQSFERRRDFLYPALLEMGFEIPVLPEGAFYIYADCSRFSRDSYTFCHQLLDEAGVAITPGKDFGSHKADQHVRFAYTREMKTLEEGVRRLHSYLKKLSN